MHPSLQFINRCPHVGFIKLILNQVFKNIKAVICSRFLKQPCESEKMPLLVSPAFISSLFFHVTHKLYIVCEIHTVRHDEEHSIVNTEGIL